MPASVFDEYKDHLLASHGVHTLENTYQEFPPPGPFIVKRNNFGVIHDLNMWAEERLLRKCIYLDAASKSQIRQFEINHEREENQNCLNPTPMESVVEFADWAAFNVKEQKEEFLKDTAQKCLEIYADWQNAMRAHWDGMRWRSLHGMEESPRHGGVSWDTPPRPRPNGGVSSWDTPPSWSTSSSEKRLPVAELDSPAAELDSPGLSLRDLENAVVAPASPLHQAPDSEKKVHSPLFQKSVRSVRSTAVTENEAQSAGYDTESEGDDAESAGDDTESAGDDAESAGDDAETAGDDAESAGDDAKSAGDDAETAGDDAESAGGEAQSAATPRVSQPPFMCRLAESGGEPVQIDSSPEGAHRCSQVSASQKFAFQGWFGPVLKLEDSFNGR